MWWAGGASRSPKAWRPGNLVRVRGRVGVRVGARVGVGVRVRIRVRVRVRVLERGVERTVGQVHAYLQRDAVRPLHHMHDGRVIGEPG